MLPKLLMMMIANNKNVSSLHEARAFHGLMVAAGFLNAPFSTRLHCNAVLRAYVHSADFSQAIHLFNHLVFNLRFIPDNYTFPLVLKACSGLSSLEHGRNVAGFITRHPHLKPNVYTKCALIDMFAKCGSLDEAHKVFDEMPLKERDLASWTSIICGWIQAGQELKALCLFEEMRQTGTRPDSALVAAMLPACGRLESRQAGNGMALQGCALKTGVHDDLFVSNAAMDMYCKFGDPHRAYVIFRGMPCKDHVSWRTLIAGYSHNCLYERSLDLYLERTKKSKLTPDDVHVVASVFPAIGKLNLSEQGKAMHGFIIKHGFDDDVVLRIALMDMYSSCGLTREMDTLLSVWPDIMVWNSAIAGHAAGEKFDLALIVFRRMWTTSSQLLIRPNSVTLVSILPICTKMGVLKQGMELHCYAVKNTVIMAVSVSNSLIDMYCKCGYLGLGRRVFDHMSEKDIVSYNTLISAYGFCGYGKQALILFDEMICLGIKPTKATFVGLLSACSHSGLVDEGWSVYRSMIDSYGICPNMEHYSCMVDLFGRAGRIRDACNFIRRMPEKPEGSVLGCLVAACQFHGITEPVDLLEEILQDNVQDSGYHILLSNMYASTKKWKDASRVRALIKEKGLRKKPGSSLIQMGCYTHIFDARDTAHAELSKIQQVLEILSSEMKEEWCCGVDPSFSIPSIDYFSR
ncbi:pentatricopeptide repeat (PPR) superfamily protein [Striga asiatica]|uniref:Pentatricopeptide repeat (PPR) superfamily protein n=1 Tax=Striga asiatica TaxID=4170 RepID=A0A5A7QL95_STRAF|nr:pentatricopeptide repeat (PPR) superfamily protein [Striga asiatica]